MPTSSGTSETIQPTYSDDDIFELLQMQFGAPPRPIAARYKNDPGLKKHVDREAQYFNDVTSLIIAMRPNASIADVFELRERFYKRFGIFHFATL